MTRVGRAALVALELVWWFIRHQGITVAWMTVVAAGFWLAWFPLGVIAAGLALFVLYEKTAKDAADLR